VTPWTFGAKAKDGVALKEARVATATRLIRILMFNKSQSGTEKVNDEQWS
jgi:hypothetical protein